MGNAQKKMAGFRSRTGSNAAAGTSRRNNNNNINNNNNPKQLPSRAYGGSTDSESLEEIISKGSIHDSYEVNTKVLLGRGHYASVNLGMDRRTMRQVAVKRIQINKSRVEALQREVQVLRKIGEHPNIVKLHDLYIDEKNNELQLVLELLKGGELFDRMVEKGPYSEREASHHIRKIGLALKYLHRHGIVHRDLKPENLLLTDKSDDAELKIADFGLSRIVDDVASSTMQTVCGTWAYCAPEVKETAVRVGGSATSKATYTAAVDLWSVGVIMFVILGAYHPFDPDGDASDEVLWENICRGQFDFEDPAWDSISGQAKDLITRLIVLDPSKRYTTDELLAHPWVRQTASVPATPITPQINNSLRGFIGHKQKAPPSMMMQMQHASPNQVPLQPPQQQMQHPYATRSQVKAPPQPAFHLGEQPQFVGSNYTPQVAALTLNTLMATDKKESSNMMDIVN